MTPLAIISSLMLLVTCWYALRLYRKRPPTYFTWTFEEMLRGENGRYRVYDGNSKLMPANDPRTADLLSECEKLGSIFLIPFKEVSKLFPANATPDDKLWIAYKEYQRRKQHDCA